MIETVIIRHISGDYIVGAIHVGGRLHEATLRLPGVFGWSPLLTITGAEATPGNQTGGVIFNSTELLSRHRVRQFERHTDRSHF